MNFLFIINGTKKITRHFTDMFLEIPDKLMLEKPQLPSGYMLHLLPSGTERSLYTPKDFICTDKDLRSHID